MSRYHDLHFFIDESGNLDQDPGPRNILLVGGVLLFGPYDRATDDQALASILRGRLKEVRGDYPRDLHFFGRERTLPNAKMETFLQKVRQDLAGWAGNRRELYGVSISHRRDIFPSGPSLLVEKEYDNRYLFMLWTLLEHLLFVDGAVAEFLAEDARVHLHISNRAFKFDPQAISPDELLLMGFQPHRDRDDPSKFVVESVLRAPDVLHMLQLALRQRWSHTTLKLGRIEVRSTRYRDLSGEAIMYLPDLYLGPTRLAEMEKRRAGEERWKLFTPEVQTTPVNPLQPLEYGPALEALAQMQAALNAGNVEHYLALAEHDQPDGEGRAFAGIRRRQEEAAAGLLKASPKKLIGFLEEACAVVDRPGRAREGQRWAEHAARLLRWEDVHAEALLAQARLSFANHTGDVAAADELWADFEQRVEPRLAALGLKGFQLRAELRTRRAVSLTDQFLYDEAEGVLQPVIADQEKVRDVLRQQPGQEALYELGACLGTLGQVCAFRGTKDQQDRAETYFRQAMTYFPEAGDRGRQWVYLGHLACDRGAEAGRALWDEVTRELPELGGDAPIARAGAQFLVALQLKGLWVFAGVERLRAFLERWDKEKLLDRFLPEQRQQIPFGLIQQAVALNHARVWKEAGQEADRARKAEEGFESAFAEFPAELLKKPLLKVLDLVAKLRGYVFKMDARRWDNQLVRKLSGTFKELNGVLMANFEAAWDQDEAGQPVGVFGRHDPGEGERRMVERARRVLQAVRFNYW
jgi:hypothetical protein